MTHSLLLLAALSSPPQCAPLQLVVAGQVMCSMGDAQCPMTPQLKRAVDGMNEGCWARFPKKPCAAAFELDAKTVHCEPEQTVPASDRK